MNYRIAERSDYATLADIWERSVIATHDFLSDSYRAELKEKILTYFPRAEVMLWIDEDKIIGFSGIKDSNLDMLFLDSDSIGKGYGHLIIKQLVDNFGVKTLDVNEDNPRALKFYQANGFEVSSRSEVDDEGQPYPTLHMKLK
ncbi:GNAT family N-acetyltransferase [Lactobacillus sp. YT155]|uniref:GNAT family N-acetyltransferase n=1 Tax=Lactobacillus sp. YT155 TaxID=3060955 RepID=UPI00265FB937|nr:GNAT family N-acetyltransferase [Lactobacillus sp. YT155]MDO1604465.1 GNAT family N-acetyltransferase [Lactobacillus sp. YT155]